MALSDSLTIEEIDDIFEAVLTHPYCDSWVARTFYWDKNNVVEVLQDVLHKEAEGRTWNLHEYS